MRAAIGILMFAAVAVAAGIFGAIAFQGLNPSLSLAILVFAAGIGVCAAVGSRTAQVPDAPPLRTWAVAVMGTIFGMAAIRAFFWLIYRDGDSIMILSPYNLGDLALHIALIRYLGSGVTFWPESPILADSPLVYPVGMDFLNSLLLLVGVPLEQGLIWCGLAGSALTAWALWRWAGAFGLAAFLFTGGLTGFAFFTGDWSMRDFGKDTEWKNAFLTMFVTQRNFLFAFPAGLLLLIHGRRLLRFGKPVLPFWVALVLYATMPVFSVHAFLFLSACLVGVFFGVTSWDLRRQLFVFGISAVLPATFAIALVTGGLSSSGDIRWHPGWMQGDAPWTFWIWNFGLMIPAWGFTIWEIVRARDRADLALAIPATAMFLACTVIAFAPWAWDNTKIMIWGWLTMVPFIWKWVIVPLPLAARAAICLVLFFTGAVSLVAGLDGRHGYRLASRSELLDTAALVANIPPDVRFATSPDYAHPLLMLGRKVAIGYPGHLWSHGLDYQDREAALTRLMMGEPSWRDDARVLKVEYLFWGIREARRFSSSSMEWMPDASDGNASGQLVPLRPAPLSN
jgi:hypothetical protein